MATWKPPLKRKIIWTKPFFRCGSTSFLIKYVSLVLSTDFLIPKKPCSGLRDDFEYRQFRPPHSSTWFGKLCTPFKTRKEVWWWWGEVKVPYISVTYLTYSLYRWGFLHFRYLKCCLVRWWWWWWWWWWKQKWMNILLFIVLAKS